MAAMGWVHLFLSTDLECEHAEHCTTLRQNLLVDYHNEKDEIADVYSIQQNLKTLDIRCCYL